MLAWVIWVITALCYFHQYFLRVSIGSLSGYLMHDFSLTILQVSDLAILFFISYVSILPFSGILIDRFGIRLIMPLASLIAGFACFLFSHATNDSELNIARLTMGGAGAFALIGSQTIIRMYFPGHLFSILSALTISIGTIGAISGGLVLVWASKHESWRVIIQHAGYVSMALAFLFLIFLKKNQTKESLQSGMKKILDDFRLFLRTRGAWIPGVYGGVVLSPIIAFASFWCAPFMMVKYQYTLEFSEFLSGLVFIGYALGSPIHSVLAQKFGLKLIMICSPFLASISLLLLLNVNLPLLISIVCLLVLGITVGAFALTLLITKLRAPLDITASAFSFNILISQLVGAGVLWSIVRILCGWHHVKIGGFQSYPLEALQSAMSLLIVASLIATLIACFIVPPKEIN
ncbi:MFS transporter [Legionella waltersii]|uniref:Lysosomal dipeptide transporter MFSD1 n=1 Tax=Legionella waltersii TaxID=66969 RepID=A0A0W1ANT5_9GAMM|nr:MFS transporter [Legionella waltersii]KTD82973.1 major facilitator superfamily (MFS) transporter [Legionella waltersii]SNU97236.1 major facilitator superfamily (MFS) transporter [Legionella waltersii]